MYRVIRARFVLAVLAVMGLFFAAGCASFRSNDVGPIQEWPPNSGGAGTRSVNVTFLGVTGELLDSFRGPTMRAYQESDLFSTVSSGSRAGSDLRANVSVSHRGEGNMLLAMLTGLTLYVIPSTASDHFTVTTTFTDAQGKEIFSVARSESVTLWQQLFLVFIMPFNSTDKVMDSAFYDLSRASLSELARSGAL